MIESVIFHIYEFCPSILSIMDVIACAVNSPHKGQWHGALMFSLNCVWINSQINNREAGDLRRDRAHYDVIVMMKPRPLHKS